MSLVAYDNGQHMRVATAYDITRGSTVKQVSIKVSHVSCLKKSNKVYNNEGRRFKVAIWADGTGSIAGTPYMYGNALNNWFDTDEPAFKRGTVTITVSPNLHVTNTSRIYVGIICDDNTKEGSICYDVENTGSLLYMNDGQSNYSTLSGSIYTDVQFSSEDVSTSMPNVVVSQIEYRTLSKSKDIGVGGNGSDPHRCYPLPDADKSVISAHWNVDYTIPEGNLKDVRFMDGTTTLSVGGNFTSLEPFWIHNRSQIKITIEPLKDNKYKTELTYKVAQNSSAKKIWHTENQTGDPTTLLICPQQEGVGSNEAFDVCISRRRKLGSSWQYSNELWIHFYTYAQPEVIIGYPKGVGAATSQPTSNYDGLGNHVLWATEVLNNKYSEERDASEQICAALPMLLTKDSGDNSGLPIFTRIHIAEYEGTYANNGTFPIPSNEDIVEGIAEPIATWEGIQLDDGTLFQISGLGDEDHTWSWIVEDDGNKFPEAFNIERFDGITHPQIPYEPTPGFTTSYKDLKTSSSPHWAIIDEASNVTTASNSSVKVYTVAKDRRMIFRAGYKYYVRVRRFHSSVAGKLGRVVEKHGKLGYNPLASSGGNYIYIGNTFQSSYEYMGSDEYYGACEFLGGNDDSSVSIRNGYPRDSEDTSPEWMDANNKRLESGAGPLIEYYLKDNRGSTAAAYLRRTWVGPDDGSSGTPADEPISDVVYPGFSAADWVIVDCCHALSSRGNIITPRPAAQEVGADHWLTFAYRHLNKALSGLETNSVAESWQNKLVATNEYNPPQRNELSNDGSIQSVPSIPYFGKTWGGSDTTITRICKMYRVLINKALEVAKTTYTDILSKYECSFCGENMIKNTKLKIFIDHQSHPEFLPGGLGDGYNHQQIYADDDYKGTYTSLTPGEGSCYQKFATNTVLRNYYQNPKGCIFGDSWQPNTAHGLLDLNLLIFNGIGTADKFPYNITNSSKSDTSPVYTQFGNQYSWWPVVNATHNKGLVNINPMCDANEIACNINGADFADRFMNDNGEDNNVDKAHTPKINNSYQPWLSFDLSKSNSSEAVHKPYNMYNEYGHNDGSLYTSVGDMDVQSGTEWVYRGSEANYGQPSQQLFSGNESNPSDSAGKEGPNQTRPGKLYKRVHPSQDCECGTIQTNRTPIPTRVDANYPLVRTSHYLWFKTFIHGKLLITLEFMQEPHDPQYVSVSNADGTTSQEYSYCNILEARLVNADEDNAAWGCECTSSSSAYHCSKCGKDATFMWNRYIPIPAYDTDPVNNWGLTVTLCNTNRKASGEASTTDGYNDKYVNVMEVYGEDNGGLGRCLSADDSTALWYDDKGNPHGVNADPYAITSDRPKVDLHGGIEIPLRVRFTPLLQPILTDNSTIIPETVTKDIAEKTRYPAINNTSNVIALQNYKAKNANNIQSNLVGEAGFSLNISYGMFRSAMKGKYVTRSFSSSLQDSIKKSGVSSGDCSSADHPWSNLDNSPVYLNSFSEIQQQTSRFNVPTQTNDINSKIGANTILPAKNQQWFDYNSDIYPAVGICNAFLVMLVPHGAQSNYANKTPNFYSNRDNYEDWGDDNARTIIVANMMKDRSYEYVDTHNVLNSTDTVDHKLRTFLNCQFDYYSLRRTRKIYTSLKDEDDRNRRPAGDAYKLKVGVWYDLVIVPIFTNRDEFQAEPIIKLSDSGEVYDFTDYDFQYKESKAGTCAGGVFGGDSGSESEYVDYYGSTPLAIKKFLKITSFGTSGGGSTVDDPDDTEETEKITDPPFNREGCIMFPNVNNRLYAEKSNKYGYVNEVPGFWLNNTFRLICRAPHFRDADTIRRWAKDHGADLSDEVSLEEATSNQLKGSEKCKEFIFSDCMVHFGKYDDYVYVLDNGKFVKDFRSDYDPDIHKGNTGWKFNSEEFQTALDQHATDKEWLNERNIFTMRTNGDAFSKCTPAEKANGDPRDVIKAGSFDSTGSHYQDRFFEINPSMLNVQTPYPEGYYIQTRFLNQEYATSSESGVWSAWNGGLCGGGILEHHTKAADDNDWQPKDISLEYCVPIRDHNQIRTEFMQYIKESTPGSGLNTSQPHIYVNNPYYSNSGLNLIPGSGSESHNDNYGDPSKLSITDVQLKSTYFDGEGNYHDSDVYDPVTETKIAPQSIQELSEYPEDKQQLYKYVSDGKALSSSDVTYPASISLSHTTAREGAVVNTSYSDYDIPNKVYDKHQIYWEINYLDYLVRNMAKLYQCDWIHAMPRNVSTKVTSEDAGWTRAKDLFYKSKILEDKAFQRNPNLDEDSILPIHADDANNAIDLSHLRKDSKRIVSECGGDCPINVNRYFRKNIAYADYDNLMNAMKHIVDFLRDPAITGKHCDLIDPKLDISGSSPKATGSSVLPMESSEFEFEEHRKSKRTGVKEGNHKIGHSMENNDLSFIPSPHYAADDPNSLVNQLECNYLQQIMNAISYKLTKPSDNKAI